MLFLKTKTKKNFLKSKEKNYFWRFFLSIRAVFLLIFLFFIIFSFVQKTQAQPVEESTSVSARIKGEGLPGGGPSIHYGDVIFKGLAYPNAFITILKNDAVAKTGLADASGDFSFELNGIPSGIWQFALWAEDEDTRKSPTLSFTVVIIRDSTILFSNIFFPPTVELSSDKISQGKNLDIFGYTAPESEINIFIDSLANIYLTAQADTNGQWFYSFNSSILENEGYYTIKAKAVSPDGLISDFSETLQFYLGRPSCAGADLNQDGRVDMIDFSILLYWWEIDNDCADQNDDGTVGLIDFSIMMYFWTN